MKGGSHLSCRIVALTTCSETLGVAGPPSVQRENGCYMYHHIIKLTTNFIVKSFLRHRIISLYIMHQLLFSLNCKQSQIYTYTYTIHICEHRTCIREYEIGIIIVHVRLLFTLLLSLVGLPCFIYTAISWCCVPPIAECFDPFNMIAL